METFKIQYKLLFLKMGYTVYPYDLSKFYVIDNDDPDFPPTYCNNINELVNLLKQTFEDEKQYGYLKHDYNYYIAKKIKQYP